MEPTLQPGQHIADFEVIRVLGRGAMGAVYEVQRGDTRYALKVPQFSDPDSSMRFKREIQALAAVDRHPHIVRVVTGSLQPFPYLVMELVEAPTLGQALRDGQKFDLPTIRLYASQLASALALLHEMGIIHRDLKPDNVFMTPQGLKLADFGLASDERAETLTATGAFIGTPLTAAPEQWERKLGELGPAADIWALGVIILWLIRGEPPFSGESILTLHKAILLGPELDDPELRATPALRSLLEEIFQQNPSRRPSANELYERLLSDGLSSRIKHRRMALAISILLILLAPTFAIIELTKLRKINRPDIAPPPEWHRERDLQIEYNLYRLTIPAPPLPLSEASRAWTERRIALLEAESPTPESQSNISELKTLLDLANPNIILQQLIDNPPDTTKILAELIAAKSQKPEDPAVIPSTSRARFFFALRSGNFEEAFLEPFASAPCDPRVKEIRSRFLIQARMDQLISLFSTFKRSPRLENLERELIDELKDPARLQLWQQKLESLSLSLPLEPENKKLQLSKILRDLGYLNLTEGPRLLPKSLLLAELLAMDIKELSFRPIILWANCIERGLALPQSHQLSRRDISTVVVHQLQPQIALEKNRRNTALLGEAWEATLATSRIGFYDNSFLQNLIPVFESNLIPKPKSSVNLTASQRMDADIAAIWYGLAGYRALRVFANEKATKLESFLNIDQALTQGILSPYTPNPLRAEALRTRTHLFRNIIIAPDDLPSDIAMIRSILEKLNLQPDEVQPAIRDDLLCALELNSTEPDEILESLCSLDLGLSRERRLEFIERAHRLLDQRWAATQDLSDSGMSSINGEDYSSAKARLLLHRAIIAAGEEKDLNLALSLIADAERRAPKNDQIPLGVAVLIELQRSRDARSFLERRKKELKESDYARLSDRITRAGG